MSTNTSTNIDNNQQLPINKEIVTKILNIISYGLVKGLGNPEPGKMCIEAAVCFAYGLPHNDNPPCVGSEVKKFKIGLNDCNWSSDLARANGMKKLAIAQLGSNTIDQKKFFELVKIKEIQQIIPFLRKNLKEEYVKFENNELNEEYKKVMTFEDCKNLAAKLAKHYNYNNYNNNYYYNYNNYNFYNYNYYYNYKNNYNYYYNYNNYYNYNSSFDNFLNLNAKIALEALQELKSPGCEYLYLCDQ